MEFKINQQQIEIKRRESFFATIFVTLMLFIGAAGILGPEPSMVKLIAAGLYILFFCFMIKYIHSDLKKTELKMQTHRLVIENNRLIFKHDNLCKELDLHDIHSIRFKYKKEAINTIFIDIKKNYGFKIEGYEQLDEIMSILKESVHSSKIVSLRK